MIRKMTAVPMPRTVTPAISVIGDRDHFIGYVAASFWAAALEACDCRNLVFSFPFLGGCPRARLAPAPRLALFS